MQQSASAEPEDKNEYKVSDDEKIDFCRSCAADAFYNVGAD